LTDSISSFLILEPYKVLYTQTVDMWDIFIISDTKFKKGLVQYIRSQTESNIRNSTQISPTTKQWILEHSLQFLDDDQSVAFLEIVYWKNFQICSFLTKFAFILIPFTEKFTHTGSHLVSKNILRFTGQIESVDTRWSHQTRVPLG
jgi:hypothetical protein